MLSLHETAIFQYTVHLILEPVAVARSSIFKRAQDRLAPTSPVHVGVVVLAGGINEFCWSSYDWYPGELYISLSTTFSQGLATAAMGEQREALFLHHSVCQSCCHFQRS